MPLWQRLLITLAAMLLASYLVGLLWQWMFTASVISNLCQSGMGILPGASVMATFVT